MSDPEHASIALDRIVEARRRIAKDLYAARHVEEQAIAERQRLERLHDEMVSEETAARHVREAPDEETCPRCHLVECSAECIAAEQAEIDAYDGQRPRKFS